MPQFLIPSFPTSSVGRYAQSFFMMFQGNSNTHNTKAHTHSLLPQAQHDGPHTL